MTLVQQYVDQLEVNRPVDLQVKRLLFLLERQDVVLSRGRVCETRLLFGSLKKIKLYPTVNRTEKNTTS